MGRSRGARPAPDLGKALHHPRPGGHPPRPGLQVPRPGPSAGRRGGPGHHPGADSHRHPRGRDRPPPRAAGRRLHERSELRQGRVRAAGVHHRRAGNDRQRLDDADELPIGRTLHLAAGGGHQRWQGQQLRQRSLRSGPRAVQRADRRLRRHPGGARPHRRQRLANGQRANPHRQRGGPRREALGAFGDPQVPPHRARPRVHRPCHGHPWRQGHHHGPEQLPGSFLAGRADLHHGGRREHPLAQPDDLRPGRDPLPSVRTQGNGTGPARGQGPGRPRVRRAAGEAHRLRRRQRRQQLPPRVSAAATSATRPATASAVPTSAR